MKRPSNLSESLHRQLNSYALAASAAGVSLMALAQPAEGKIVYTNTHVVLGRNHANYHLDLNHDRVKDFKLAFRIHSSFYSTGSSMTVIPDNGSNQIIGSSFGFASALKVGVRIGSSGQFSPWYRLMAKYTKFATTHFLGDWANGSGYGQGVKNRYLVLRFFIHGQAHYGWARLNVKINGFKNMATTLTGYAYETIPNKTIVAGKTHGPDVVTVQGASLGQLAQGASTVSAWRTASH